MVCFSLSIASLAGLTPCFCTNVRLTARLVQVLVFCVMQLMGVLNQLGLFSYTLLDQLNLADTLGC